MLKNIPKIIGPDLLKILSEMGHSDEIVLADGNFPAMSLGERVIRMDSIGVKELLRAILHLLPLDDYGEDNVIMMKPFEGKEEPSIWKEYREILYYYEKDSVKIIHLDRAAFYERAKNAYAIIATGESALKANIILKKGVIRE